jgi:hypothetical protein
MGNWGCTFNHDNSCPNKKNAAIIQNSTIQLQKLNWANLWPTEEELVMLMSLLTVNVHMCGWHMWASTLILMSAISDIQHQHLLFRYRRQICRTENCHSEIGSVPISTSGPILISTLLKKNYTICWILSHAPWNCRRVLCLSAAVHTHVKEDVGYRIKLYSDIRYQRFRYQA